MPASKVYPKSDDGDVVEFIRKTFEKRECNRFRSETIKEDIEFCECGYSRKVHSDEALHNEFNQSEPSTKTSPTDAFGKVDFVEERDTDSERKTELKNIRYVRLDYKTDVNKVSKLFRVWKLVEPDVILSVLSDSESLTTESNEMNETMSNGSVQNTRKTICSSLVEAAASTNGWIITGGLNKGVDQLIGNEVKQRLARKDNIPEAVLGISNWGSIEKKGKFLSNSSGSNGYASDSNPNGMSLDPHHTHFLLVDDGTQKKSGCECVLRKMVEFTMTKRETSDVHKDQRKPLIYIIIGGSINVFSFVERALANGIPVIIAVETGGAADIIAGAAATREGASLEYLPEITEKLFHRLEDLLIEGSVDAIVARRTIAKIKAEIKLEPFLEVVELLDKAKVPVSTAQQFRNEIANLKKTTANELLAGIKDLLITKQTQSDGSNHSSTNAESDTVNHLCAVIEQMLVINGIQAKNAKQAADSLEPKILNETVAKVKLVFSNLKAIRTHNQLDLLIKFNVHSKEKKSITSFIVEALKKVKWTKPCDVYMLVADWDNEKFFKQLLLENWMRHDHEHVFMKLLNKDKPKYVKLMMEHIGNSNWMTKTHGPLDEDFRKHELCAFLLQKVNDPGSNSDTEDERYRIKGKMLFIWCVQKQMPETAMLFWKQGQDCLAMSLVAYYESREQKRSLVDKEGYDSMQQQMQYFSKLSLDLLKTLYASDHRNTHDLLVGAVEDLDGLTPLQIAIDANFKTFIAEAPVQKLLDKIWVKNIENYSKYKYVPILFSEACPLLAPVMFNFRIPSHDSNDERHGGLTDQKSEFVGSFFWKIKTFINTPCVKFTYGFISYIGYLILFSIVMLTDFRTNIRPPEMALDSWTLVLIIEELRQAIVERSDYKNAWNYLDIGALVTYIVGFILRMIYYGDPTICPSCLYVARIVFVFSLVIFFCRSLQFLSVAETLGPMIYMMRRLFADLFNFMLILTVFVAAYGVASNVILYPNQPLNGKLLQDVFYDAWWSLLLQFDLDGVLGLNCKDTITAQYCADTTGNDINYESCKQDRCPANTWIVSVLLAFYALLTVIMMLNVLIAMFVITFSTANGKHKEVSRWQRYRLIREYSSRSMVPPPLCAITYPFFIIKYMFNLCKYCLQDEDQFQAYNASRESPLHDKDNKDVVKKQREWKPLSRSPPKAFARTLSSRVKDWDHRVLEEYHKNNKNEWPLNRMESERDKTDQFHETPLGRFIDQQIRNQITQGQLIEETDPRAS